MRTASVSDTKNNLSALLEQVKQGHSILITDRNRPVARLEPVAAPDEASAGRLARLERAGLIRRGRGKLDVAAFRKMPLAKASRGASVLTALLEERQEGR